MFTSFLGIFPVTVLLLMKGYCLWFWNFPWWTTSTKYLYQCHFKNKWVAKRKKKSNLTEVVKNGWWVGQCYDLGEELSSLHFVMLSGHPLVLFWAGTPLVRNELRAIHYQHLACIKKEHKLRTSTVTSSLVIQELPKITQWILIFCQNIQ